MTLPTLTPLATGFAQVALDTLMPMHVALDAEGRVRATGPTIGRIVEAPLGAPFFDLFAIRRPEGIGDPATLRARAGERLFLRSRGAEGTFRGVAVAGAEGGTLVNLSFGPGIIEAVRRYALTEADFAATDLAIELLYVVEAKSMIMEELRTLNLRLQGAKNEAEQQARTDPLTGLRNRRAFDLALDHVISDQGAAPLASCMWTLISSRPSMTRSGTLPVMPCCATSRPCLRKRREPLTPWRVSVEMSSWSFCRMWLTACVFSKSPNASSAG